MSLGSDSSDEFMQNSKKGKFEHSFKSEELLSEVQGLRKRSGNSSR